MEEELLVFLRNQDILSISERGVTTVTDTFSGDGSTVDFTLSNQKVKNVRSVTVDASSKSVYSDYSVAYNTEASDSIVTFSVAPVSGSSNISIEYDYGTKDKIFADIPQLDIGLSSYPRISVTYISEASKPFGLGNKSFLTSGLFSVVAYAEKSNKVNSILKDIKVALIDNVNSFYYFSPVTFRALGPMLADSNRGKFDADRGRLQQRNLDFNANFIVERAT